MNAKGKWAQGIRPRNFCWVIKGQLAVCERPGGYGQNHRRVRRQEEIIWIRENGFSRIVSLIPSQHNLHNYDEQGVAWLHRPLADNDDPARFLREFFPELRDRLAGGEVLLMHRDELGDKISGVVAAYLVWAGMITHTPQAITVTEQILSRQLGPQAREMVEIAARLQGGVPAEGAES